MDAIPGSRPVAFRMPCCDSLNTPSPRFFAEIFNRTTPAGNFLTIDSSVLQRLHGQRLRSCRASWCSTTRRRRSSASTCRSSRFVNTIEDYPYPYVIGRLCWEFPCVVPSDWRRRTCSSPTIRETVGRLEAGLDATVVKQGVFTLVFHPYDWIATSRSSSSSTTPCKQHGKKVKFLNFREAQERLDKNLLAGQSLRTADGGDNGVRLLDLNDDGYIDVVIGNDRCVKTRIWSPKGNKWIVDGDFPAAGRSPTAGECATAACVSASCTPTACPAAIVRNEASSRRLALRRRQLDDRPDSWLTGLESTASRLPPAARAHDRGRAAARPGRRRPLRADRRQCRPAGRVFASSRATVGRSLPFALPDGRDDRRRPGPRRRLALRRHRRGRPRRRDLFQRDAATRRYLFDVARQGLVATTGRRQAAATPSAIPMIARAGTNNGAWFHDRQLLVQNEDTDKLHDLVDRSRSTTCSRTSCIPGPRSPAAVAGRRPTPGPAFRSSWWRPSRW